MFRGNPWKKESTLRMIDDQEAMTPPEAVEHYKHLSDVERGFRSLKDPLGMRPIWHRAARRVKAHIFVAALAFLIERMLDAL